jgi:hypothetical protein
VYGLSVGVVSGVIKNQAGVDVDTSGFGRLPKKEPIKIPHPLSRPLPDK